MTIKHKIKILLAKNCFVTPKHYCSLCKNKVNFMGNCGVKTDVFKRLNIIGGGYRKNVVCPICGSNDRMRWLDIVLERYTNIYTDECEVLHIAPEESIEKKIRTNRKCHYTTGDIEIGKADMIVDITAMKFANGVFDYIILNHVLEHVPDEDSAIKEIRRCLKPQGMMIVSFPINIRGNTFEDRNIIRADDREKIYGQRDHCRLYGIDAKERISNYGFSVKEYIVSDFLSDEEIQKNILIRDDRVFLCKKICD